MIEYSCDSCGCMLKGDNAQNAVALKFFSIYHGQNPDVLPFWESVDPKARMHLCESCSRALNVLFSAGTIQTYADIETKKKINQILNKEVNA